MAEERLYRNNKKLAGRLGVSIVTWKRWIYQGKVKALKTIGRRYRIPESEILRIMGKKKEPLPKNGAAVDARVSPYEGVKDSLLNRQLGQLRGYASKHRYKMLEKTREVGSGLNDRRPKPLHILRVTERMVDVIIVEDKDGLTGFEFNYYLAKIQRFTRSQN